MDKYVHTNGIRLHYLDHPGDEPVIVLLHGLTANAHAFDSYVEAGLSPSHRVLAVDLRGRGLSDKPETGYSIAEHAEDIIGLLDEQHIPKAVIGGHSFGALLSIYISNHYPDRVEKLILVDAAARLHPNVREMVAPSMLRLTQTFPSFDAFCEKLKHAPYLEGRWNEQMERYYRADVITLPDGCVRPHSQLGHIQQAIRGALDEGIDWLHLIRHASHPAILIHAPEPYGPPDGDPILPTENAWETVNMMPDCIYAAVPGNHLTMLFGEGAKATVEVIEEFLS